MNEMIQTKLKFKLVQTIEGNDPKDEDIFQKYGINIPGFSSLYAENQKAVKNVSINSVHCNPLDDSFFTVDSRSTLKKWE
mmetsp:Transcript_8537/g.9678  ORF Transcript_8537/g.9678 Transcript_8537/m.9678 type:complete len:80 (-) Transcript_8537:37-276(-)